MLAWSLESVNWSSSWSPEQWIQNLWDIFYKTTSAKWGNTVFACEIINETRSISSSHVMFFILSRATVVLRLLKGSWRIAFIKTHIQPPSGGVNRESLRGGVEGGGRALPRHVPKPLQPGPCLALVTDHRGAGGPLRTPVSPSEDADDQWPPSSGMHWERGADAFNLFFCSEAVRERWMLYYNRRSVTSPLSHMKCWCSLWRTGWKKFTSSSVGHPIKTALSDTPVRCCVCRNTAVFGHMRRGRGLICRRRSNKVINPNILLCKLLKCENELLFLLNCGSDKTRHWMTSAWALGNCDVT